MSSEDLISNATWNSHGNWRAFKTPSRPYGEFPEAPGSHSSCSVIWLGLSPTNACLKTNDFNSTRSHVMYLSANHSILLAWEGICWIRLTQKLCFCRHSAALQHYSPRDVPRSECATAPNIWAAPNRELSSHTARPNQNHQIYPHFRPRLYKESWTPLS